MSKPAGFGRHSSSDSVPGTSATINTPQKINPLEPTATITKAWPAKQPLPSSLPTGPTVPSEEA